MSDFRKQLREHYDAKTLPADKTEAILTSARMVAQAQVASETNVSEAPPRWRKTGLPALAATLLALAGLAAWWQRESARVPYAEVMALVLECFASKAPLDPAPQDKGELRALMIAHGAPPDFRIPPSLLSLESAACKVVAVRDRSAYLMCFWSVDKPDRGLPELVHLIVAKAADFRDAPLAPQSQFQSRDGWSFASWREGEILYTLTAAAPMETLRRFLAAEVRERNPAILGLLLSNVPPAATAASAAAPGWPLR